MTRLYNDLSHFADKAIDGFVAAFDAAPASAGTAELICAYEGSHPRSTL
jgi:hypothetical protein